MRSCWVCRRGIERCNGYTLARDIVDERFPSRELCGRCVEIIELFVTQLRSGVEVDPAPLPHEPSSTSGPACADCGMITRRTGTCYTCSNCGWSAGCG